MSTVFSTEMQKAATCLCYFFQLVLIFGKATRKTIQALLLAVSLGLTQMMLSPIKSAPLQDIASAVSRSRICHNLQVFGANFLWLNMRLCDSNRFLQL